MRGIIENMSKTTRLTARITAGVASVIIGILIALFCLYWFLLRDLPSPTKLSSDTLPQSTQIYDRHQTLLYTIYANKNQTFIPLSQIPQYMQEATIAIEDKDFYRHGAVDFRGIARAFVYTVFHKQTQGGSTLTQQLVKNTLLTPERTLPRKIKEVVLSFATEALYPKSKIIEMYLNQSPYGGTAYGIEAASMTYFGKHAKDLTLAQSALLAGLPEAPTTLSPFGAHPELAKRRQEEVLRRMTDQGYITKAQADKAAKEQLQYAKVTNDIKAPHFVLYIKQLLSDKYGIQKVEEGGLKVITSLDLPLQEYAQATVAAKIASLKNQRVGNGAALITDPSTGEILAMVGSKDYFDVESDGNVNITTQMRQPGSSIKPINYATGLAKGYTAATPFVDTATCYPGAGGQPQYCPRNYDGKFHGVVQMRFALGNSLNIPAVKMLKANGLEAMIATASAMGINFDSPDKYGLSLSLGGGEVMMTELATAFGVFANGGYRIDLHPILKITDGQGKIIEEYTPPQSPIFGKKVLPAGVAFIMTQMLMDNNARLLAFGPASQLKIGNQPVAVKTGTTNDYKDNWTIGYTSNRLVAAWVGNNDNTPMSGVVSGVTGAAPIWHDLMEHLLTLTPAKAPSKPAEVIGMTVCSTSGLLPGGGCPTRFEYFIKGMQPKKADPGPQKVFIDKTTRDLAKPGQTDNVEEKEEIVITDPTGVRYCLTCPHPEQATPTPAP